MMTSMGGTKSMMDSGGGGVSAVMGNALGGIAGIVAAAKEAATKPSGKAGTGEMDKKL